ncbi:Protein of unknown function (DUF3152) [Lentzea aerocolonigenes]|nr:DUF3152 domain-containing protein [Lentzea aerocolonigenes]MCP2241744.1 Protein of unknown function (DUF3152) [Lentzea aerocolonigenes]
MTIGRIVMYVFAAMLAGVTIGLLKSWPVPPPPQHQDVAQPRVPPVVASISVRTSPPPSTPPPSSSAAVAAQAARRPGPELPPGEPVRSQGEGWWRTVAGTTAQVGAGRVRTYSVEVEQGVVAPQAQHPFAAAVDRALADPRAGSRPVTSPSAAWT